MAPDATPEDAVRGIERAVSKLRRRRRSERRIVETEVQVTLDEIVFEGRSKDISEGGLLLFADERLPLRVRLTVDGEEIERVGRLTRSQRMPGGEVAYAIQFDGPDGES